MTASKARGQLVYKTEFGHAYRGDARKVLGRGSKFVAPSSVDLIFTSPPYALTRPKDYGNESHDRYLRWFETFIPGIKRVLSATGSVVVDIGGSWLPGAPRRSTYHFALALLLERHFEFCQEFYWYNPSKLPSPAEWVTRRRLRAKDSVNLILWFAKNASLAHANNSAVKRRYSASMMTLLKGGYQVRHRPSDHKISGRFMVDNGGAIPSNLLGFAWAGEEANGHEGSYASLLGRPFEDSFDNLIALANTNSNDRYLKLCRENGIKPHPARFPIGLPGFFIELLTQPGDLVCDLFAGSNTTGAAAEALKRRWISVDLDNEGELAGTYVRASAFRFPNAKLTRSFIHVPKGTWRPETRDVKPLVQLPMPLAD